MLKNSKSRPFLPGFIGVNRRPNRLFHHLPKILLLTAALAASSCGNNRVRVETDEGAPRLESMLSVAGPRAPAQLLNGWYNLEDNSWRWTAGHFSVILRVPPGAAQNGATLKLQLSIPQPLIDRVKSASLTATVKGTALPPETYTKTGAFTFTRDVPAALLNEDAAKVEFALDKFLPAGAVENRELGLIATAVGFEPKSAPPK